MVKPKPARTRSPATQTVRPAIEQQLARLQEQLEAVKAQVRQAQQLSSLGTAAATIAHEVNNLLTPILGFAEYAVITDDVEFHKKALHRTIKNVKILVGMSERILRLGAAKETKAERVELRHVAQEALDSLCRDPRKDGVTVYMEIPESLCVLADGLQVQQVLFNILLNAREAMAKDHGGRLTISAYSSDKEVVTTIHNTGDAISPEVLPTIFDAFSSSKPVNRNGKERCGGLGLALCRDLMEENDGSISVTSTPKDGTTFQLTLPASNGAADGSVAESG